MKKGIRVLCGYVNTGGLAYKLAEGLRKNGIRADSIVIDDHTFAYPYHKKLSFIGNKPNLVNRLLKYYYFIKHTFRYDVFIFNTRSTMLSKKGDLKILKKLGKKTAMIYVGCDIRDKNFYLNSPDKYTVCKNCTIEYQEKVDCVMEKKINESGVIQENIDASFAHPFDATILEEKFHYFYLLLELEDYKPKYETNKRIRIIHAPSDAGIKGTNYVLDAIEKLKKRNLDFEFELATGKSQSDLKEAIRNSDILIDQMVAGWYGLISVEAMALGKTTVCFLKQSLYNFIPDIPIINLNPDNLAEGLEKLINEREKLQSIGMAGRRFAEKYHDYSKNSMNILSITTGKNLS